MNTREKFRCSKRRKIVVEESSTRVSLVFKSRKKKPIIFRKDKKIQRNNCDDQSAGEIVAEATPTRDALA